MTDKMTDNEIITALEHCSASMDCDNCGFGISENCVGDLLKTSLDLIKRQKTEIDILIRKKEALRDEIAEKDAEIERLRKENERFADIGKMYSEIRAEAKSEAYREFAERLCEGRVSNDPVVIAAKVELEELTEKSDKE